MVAHGRIELDRRTSGKLALLMAGGVVWGVAAQLDPRLLSALGAPWLVLAFTAGALGRRSWWLAIGAGAGVLVAGVLAYYAMQVVERGAALYALAMSVGWSVVALPAGAAFGAAGAAWRRGSLPLRAVAGALAPAALAAEALVLAEQWRGWPGATSVLAAEAAAAAIAAALVARRPEGDADAIAYRGALGLGFAMLLGICMAAELTVRGVMRQAGWNGA